AHLTSFLAHSADETPKSFQSINTLLLNTVRRPARTADRTPKRDSNEVRTPRRSQSVTITHFVIQAHFLYSLSRQAVTSHGII
ncbi:hypothetical protein AVEN_121639-1, partial [Araneus ventricosus]